MVSFRTRSADRYGQNIAALLFVLAALAGASAFSSERDIYPAADRAKLDLAGALSASAATHRRILLDFGGNWCPDCHVLDLYFHDAANQPILEANYILVHINIGRLNENLDIAERYGIPLRKGVPALAVLGEHGELLYSQKSGEFEAMRRIQSSAVTDFLLSWKGPGS
jgi:thiol:disulfide interchange protein